MNLHFRVVDKPLRIETWDVPYHRIILNVTIGEKYQSNRKPYYPCVECYFDTGSPLTILKEELWRPCEHQLTWIVPHEQPVPIRGLGNSSLLAGVALVDLFLYESHDPKQKVKSVPEPLTPYIVRRKVFAYCALDKTLFLERQAAGLKLNSQGRDSAQKPISLLKHSLVGIGGGVMAKTRWFINYSEMKTPEESHLKVYLSTDHADC